MKDKVIAALTAFAMVTGINPIAAPAKAQAATVDGTQTGTIVAGVYMRSGAGTKYRTLRTLKAGETVTIISKENAYWFKVKTANGTIGYVSTSSRYISVETVPTPVPMPAPEPPVSKADAIITAGMTYIGTPYKFGAVAGQTANFDCSSFVQYIFGQNDVTLPRSSKAQSSVGTNVSFAEVQKGDLLFFDASVSREGIDHVGVYIGDGKMIHANPSGGGVNVKDLAGFWTKYLVKVQRVI